MPRSTRNFWLDLHVDGRTTRLEGGPRSATGGIDGWIKIRGEGGTVEDAIHITGEAFSDGELRLYIEPGPDSRIEPYTINHPRGFRIISKR